MPTHDNRETGVSVFVLRISQKNALVVDFNGALSVNNSYVASSSEHEGE
jgi:hypothetical protein